MMTGENYCKYASQKRNETQQTRFAPVMPPNQKTKARFMNVGRLIRWGKKLLSFFKRAKNERLDGIDFMIFSERFKLIQKCVEEKHKIIDVPTIPIKCMNLLTFIYLICIYL
jgi:hypothetical protein